jgi:hypothetical protein
LFGGPAAGDDVGAIPSPRGAHDMVFAADYPFATDHDAIKAKALA